MPNRRAVLRRRWVAVLIVLALAGVAYAVYFTPLLGVRSIDVAGTNSLTRAEVREAAGIPEGQPLARVDTGAAEERVAELPAVATVDVSRSWPATIEITVGERKPLGFYDTGQRRYLVDAGGVAYKAVERPPKGLPELKLAEVGPRDPTTRAVTRVLTSLPPKLGKRVVAVSADTPGSVEFTVASGKVVRWGDADDAVRKAKVLEVLLTREGRTYDVSSPELPTVS